MNCKTNLITALMLSLLLAAQTVAAQTAADSTAFRGYLYNQQYDVYMRINFHEQDVVISWQDLLGPLPGFLAKEGGSYCWIVNDVEVNGPKATLEMVNDTGSDDLTATLTQENDTLYVLRQKSGATLKLPNKGKWMKLPQTLTFVRKKTGK